MNKIAIKTFQWTTEQKRRKYKYEWDHFLSLSKK